MKRKKEVKKKKEIKSVIRKGLEEIRSLVTVEDIRTKFKEVVGASKIKEQDKTKMLDQVERCDTYDSIMIYVYNCLLKYEGDGVVKPLKR